MYEVVFFIWTCVVDVYYRSLIFHDYRYVAWRWTALQRTHPVWAIFMDSSAILFHILIDISALTTDYQAIGNNPITAVIANHQLMWRN